MIRKYGQNSDHPLVRAFFKRHPEVDWHTMDPDWSKMNKVIEAQNEYCWSVTDEEWNLEDEIEAMERALL